MNVNTKLSLTQFPSYTAVGKSTVIKHRRPAADEPNDVASVKKAEDGEIVKAVSQELSADPVISDDEKQYFENLFPASVGEIRSFSPYGRNGMKQPATLGSLIDMKG